MLMGNNKYLLALNLYFHACREKEMGRGKGNEGGERREEREKRGTPESWKMRRKEGRERMKQNI